MSTLRETFLEELAEVYDAEKQLVGALPKLAKAAHHEQLRRDFEEHLEQTEEQVTRLEQVFDVLGEKVEPSTCQPMLSLLTAAEAHIEHESGDAALICAAQKVEHYEMAAYTCLQAWARLLGEEDAADLLEETLDEEEATDEKLTETAEDIISVEEERSS
jgi:ferritin-like metal-binding protein YciE